MAQVFKYVQGDTGPQIRVTLTNEDDNAPVDLTSATVTLHFREAGAESVLFSRAFFINPDTASKRCRGSSVGNRRPRSRRWNLRR